MTTLQTAGEVLEALDRVKEYQMVDIETGGPAFPIVQDACPGVHSGGVESWGMTLRDYFAAKALVAYFADGAGFALQHEASKWAYETADAMLEARK